MRYAYNILVGRPEGKRQLVRSVLRSEKNVEEIAWEGVMWIDLAQDRDRWRVLVNIIMALTS
jgi:hypothetical protein